MVAGEHWTGPSEFRTEQVQGNGHHYGQYTAAKRSTRRHTSAGFGKGGPAVGGWRERSLLSCSGWWWVVSVNTVSLSSLAEAAGRPTVNLGARAGARLPSVLNKGGEEANYSSVGPGTAPSPWRRHLRAGLAGSIRRYRRH